VKEIADTGLLVGLLDPRDQHHAWALDVIRSLSGPLHTCEAVLTEVGHLVGTVDGALRMVQAGDVIVDFDIEGEAEAVRRLLRKFADAGMDYADACVVRLSELHPHCRVYTTDRRDFSIYRRHGRHPIPCHYPPSP
jgi:predicted nucleic acid-binding protein